MPCLTVIFYVLPAEEGNVWYGFGWFTFNAFIFHMAISREESVECDWLNLNLKLYRLSLKKPIAIFECPLSKCPSASSSLGPNLLLRIVVIIPLGRSVKCFFEVRFLSASPQLVLQPCRLVQWPDSQQKCKEHVKAISSFYSQITSKWFSFRLSEAAGIFFYRLFTVYVLIYIFTFAFCYSQ